MDWVGGRRFSSYFVLFSGTTTAYRSTLQYLFFTHATGRSKLLEKTTALAPSFFSSARHFWRTRRESKNEVNGATVNLCVTVGRSFVNVTSISLLISLEEIRFLRKIYGQKLQVKWDYNHTFYHLAWQETKSTLDLEVVFIVTREKVRKNQAKATRNNHVECTTSGRMGNLRCGSHGREAIVVFQRSNQTIPFVWNTRHW